MPRLLLLATLGLSAIILLAALLRRGDVSATLFDWTGEEEWPAQIRALGHLASSLTRPQPDARSYVPVAHAGVNPFGINTFLEQEVEEAKMRRSLEMIREAGFHWIRQEFPWQDIEIHAKGDFQDRRTEPHKSAWLKYDRIVELATANGLEIIARLDAPPAWSRAVGEARGTLAPPDNYEDYGDFVAAVVKRYRGRIQYYQIWNEPNIYPEWGENPISAQQYVALLKVGYRRVKEADPAAVVISASLAQTIELGPRDVNDFIFLQQMYDYGAKDYFDILSVQSYGLWSGPGDRRMRPRVLNFSRPLYLRDIMVKNGDATKPIWASELAWNAIPADHPAYPQFGRVTDEQLARYTVLAYERARAEWPWMGVMNYWFFKRARDVEKAQPFYYFRLVEPDFTPLPVYAAMQAYTAQPPFIGLGYHQEDHWALHYQGDWRTVKDAHAVLGAMRVSERAGDSVSFTFLGSGFDLVVQRDPISSALEIVIDNQAPVIVELQRGASEYSQVAVARGLDNAKHTARLTLLARDGYARAAIDGLIVYGADAFGTRQVLGLLLVSGTPALFGWLMWKEWQRQTAA